MEPNRYVTPQRSSQALRIGLLAAGGALAAWAIARRDKFSIPLSAAGGGLLFAGWRAGRQQGIHYEVSVTINRPAEEVYRYWRNFQNLPLFMSHLLEVTVEGERRSHWKARGPLNAEVEWDAEIVDEKPNEWLVWRSLPGADVESVGSVQFRPAPGDRGTEITVALQYRPVGGRMGKVIAAMFGRNPEMTIKEDLRNFKHIMEAGEIPTTEGQPSGRRSTMVELRRAVAPDYRKSGTEEALQSA